MKKLNIMGAFQTFGGAMAVPIAFLPFTGLLLAVTNILTMPDIMGDLAHPDATFYKVMTILKSGGWTIFRNFPLLFCMALPIGLAKSAQARAALVAFFSYMAFNYFTNGMLTFWGADFGVNFSQEVGGQSGLALVGGIKTLDTSIVFSLIVGGIVTWIHNRFFEKKLHDYFSIFQGMALVFIIAFFLMIPLAWLTCLVWPKVQLGINAMQTFYIEADVLGMGLFAFVERILVPTGLHRFVYFPFFFGPAVVDGGLYTHWIENVSTYAASAVPLREQFPAAGYSLYGNISVFCSLGAGLAIYATAKKSQKKKVAALVIPAIITAMSVGITEPIEFTYLFISPVLYLLNALIGAVLCMALYMAGVVGFMGGGMNDMILFNWIFYAQNHADLIWIHLAIGFGFAAINFMVFRYVILKYNILTPGRNEDEDEVRLYSKQDYRDKKAAGKQPDREKAIAILQCVGGAENVETISNCQTRLRLVIHDPSCVMDDNALKAAGALGTIRNGRNLQIVIGLSVTVVREFFEAEVIRVREAGRDSPAPQPVNS
ncbi:PTS alpha-glucoside transporter subunit IIBC [Lelliottia sp. F153]|uniref:alpha-glucoside-specific PTS transporter subunit IIBC n=1 Tax=unclassified Lelliottia TaxID=2642424 RepID=UPI000C7F0FA4|nr:MULTISPECIES: alpha-glucoside-specific PTS transporter subunit IIBC [unclassified Lelliottia]PLY46037.1 PTS alpha-glucoside transporter subunit IIBC [Lelliottia sp. F159]PLY50410.1 PTS alpha-glucoside transporter subunit IIBC [Lelliottia sp. F154]PLY54735.1 PTS alpha-glucoside transporter subunit IIBC [Lelliottia sp. F153]